jgi:hypothetical protein
MANKKHGQTAKAPAHCSWWKHFRSEGKRMFWKAQRQADKNEIDEQSEQSDDKPD